ncbi:epoxide hydrolase [Fusarium albosuccineum]|uniref:Epoxide hydrolase n=1 Tax=Fusarium albosuccineum TaxID=1237068 RepID=A0A8H4P4I8_9HYPO|nr:epoxide hydrolase [Fusarium albosuccineum]
MVTTRTLEQGIRALCEGDNGPVIVFLSGWPQTAEAMLPLFPGLSSKHQLFALDPPGLGYSQPPESKDYSIANIGRIVYEAVAATFNKPVHVVAHDLGVWIAYAWAAQFPEQVRSLTLMDAAIPGMFSPISYPLSDETNKRLFQFSFNALPDLPEMLVEGKERAFMNWLYDTKLPHPDRIPVAQREPYIKAYSGPGKMAQGFAYYRAVETSAEQNLEFAKKKLKMPLLALGGSDGIGAGMKVVAEKIAENVQSGVIEDCGHFLPEEQPEKVSERIRQFFGKPGVR